MHTGMGILLLCSLYKNKVFLSVNYAPSTRILELKNQTLDLRELRVERGR